MIYYHAPYEWDESYVVPVLHKVPYDYKKYSYDEITDWLKEHCRAKSYRSPGWAPPFVEFEDDEDATFFALRWGG